MAGDPERSRWWQLENSWWLGLIAISFGFLTWAAFGYLGVRTGRRTWLGFAAGYLGLTVASFVLIDGYAKDDWRNTIGVVGFFACWFGGFIHGLAIRDDALDLLSLAEDPRIERARRRRLQRGAAVQIAAQDPSLAREAGIGADPDTFGGLVDVNDASAEELAELPGFDLDLGKRVVEVRKQIDGFDSVADFANVLDLPPHLVDRIRDRLICLPR